MNTDSNTSVDPNINSSYTIGPFMDNIINNFIEEIKWKKYKDKIVQNFIDPIIYDITKKYLPYIMSLFFLLIIIITLLIIIIIKK